MLPMPFRIAFGSRPALMMLETGENAPCPISGAAGERQGETSGRSHELQSEQWYHKLHKKWLFRKTSGDVILATESED